MEQKEPIPRKPVKARRRLRSSTVVLGGMGVLATALTSCGSEPDKRCVDRNSYEAGRGYRVLDSKACSSKSGSGGSSGTWYYNSGNSGTYAKSGTFDKGKAVSRGGFGCSSSSSHSGSSGG
ncbi:hypothetical protein BLA24_27030 [Streptomyces cinnamoneus]|uniref:Uncharacterized protein n=1 Tax=Streptomyces cinnamoneus TaxID=53446 RepID=A0A2G1XEL0_STRCJ|nr:hypothetical protein [Streptomyces cinnamoneus]PHQ49666.1 hypothetical protein BLA24_27030 [Streptomyces cinnamoneus]PPT14610.1 hypothetical protein CYQ11_18600 [Streptomyces cinnamoneus]